MKRNIVIAAVTAAALIGGGTATALATTGDDEGSARQAANTRLTDDDVRDDQDDRDDAARASSTDVTASEAIASALKHTSGTVVSAELDDEDDSDKVIWKVDVLSGDSWHSVSVDPSSGKVLGSHADDEDDTAQVRTALKGSSVTAEEAAKAAAGKGVVTSVDLDEDGKNKSWEAETRKSGGAEQDWKIDLKTGKVTADRDQDDDQD
ncbi:PepSY domain-containing protein [Streptomyces tuirus]|uniref:PepSY domain-containing protein n=1 Tax=Streptomyces tuirus TaxID=68278 RepID=A0A941FAX2_9ACTN|nr:PepSY domain-containing protein [Streptomyces tuirus]